VGTERFRTYMSAIAYQTESCASLPFGDGLNCVGSDVDPLHFTGKERDAATGLDNFGARYNSSATGRFMSPDPKFLMKQKLVDPQQWNMYSYVRNNPLRFTDPTGEYVCKDSAKCDSANDKAFQAQLNAIKGARDTYKSDSKEYKRLDKILSDYGGAGDKGTANGKTVQVDFTNKGDGARTQSISKDTIGVNFRSDFAQSAQKDPVAEAVLVGHEGQHVVDRSEGGHSQFAREWAAESVSQDIVQGLTPPGMGATFTVRGIEIFNSDTMLDGSRKGAWLRTTRAFDAAVKDYQEDQKNDNE
jgi:RHS repeat-associated protein